MTDQETSHSGLHGMTDECPICGSVAVYVACDKNDNVIHHFGDLDQSEYAGLWHWSLYRGVECAHQRQVDAPLPFENGG